MRMIGSLDDAQQASRFAAFLLTEGIGSQIEEEQGEWEVWIKDEDQLEKSKVFLESFRSDPNDAKYQAALASAESIKKEQERKRREYQKNVKVGAGQVVQKKFPVTILLIVLSGIFALLTNFGKAKTSAAYRSFAYTSVEPDQTEEIFKELGKNVNAPSTDTLELPRVRHASLFEGQFWRLVTPIFIHFGALHLVFNMIWLYQLGGSIENRYGSLYFLMLVIPIAVISNFVQCAVPESVGGSIAQVIPSVGLLTFFGGMSGVVFGLLGFVWIKSTIDPASRLFIPQSTILFMLGYMFFCMSPWATGIFANVANWAHGIGLMAGIAIAYLLTLMKK